MMMIKFIVSVVINIILVVSATVCCQTYAIAQYKSEELIQESINLIADYTSIQTTMVDELLQANGYIANIPITDWEQLSDFDKLYIAVGQAEQAKSGNGSRLIKAIHQQLINRIPSFVSERFPITGKHGTVTGKKVQYSSELYKGKLPRDIEKSIAIISDYVSRPSSSITARSLLSEFANCHTICFLKEIIKTHSIKYALINKFSIIKNPPRNKRIAQASLRVQMAVPAARHEPRLAATIYRFLFSSDWIMIRNAWEDAVVGSTLFAEEAVKASHLKSVEAWNTARMFLIKSLLDNGIDITSDILENSFIDTAIHDTDLAAVWGFAVAHFYPNKLALEQLIANDTDHYTDLLAGTVAHDLFREYSMFSKDKQMQLNNDIRGFLDERIDIKKILYDRGPTPSTGWVFYSTTIGRENSAMIDFTHTSNFENSVVAICPTCGVARLDPDTVRRLHDRISEQNIERHMPKMEKLIEDRIKIESSPKPVRRRGR